MAEAGVALATTISQGVSAVLVVMALLKRTDACKLSFSKLKFYKDELLQMIKIGLPAGIQGSLFSISNVIIQSSINSFGSLAMAGNTAASNIEGFVYTGMNAIYQTCLSFTSQNLGAKQIKRIRKTLIYCQIVVFVIGFVLGQVSFRLGNVLLGIYSSDPEVIAYGLVRLSYVGALYFLCGMMDVMVGALRGLGCSIGPTLIMIFGICIFRMVWLWTVFKAVSTFPVLVWSFPISWMIVCIASGFYLWYLLRRFPNENMER